MLFPESSAPARQLSHTVTTMSLFEFLPTKASSHCRGALLLQPSLPRKTGPSKSLPLFLKEKDYMKKQGCKCSTQSIFLLSRTAAILRNAICLPIYWFFLKKSPNSPSSCLTYQSIYIYTLDQVTSPHPVRRNSRIKYSSSHTSHLLKHYKHSKLP